MTKETQVFTYTRTASLLRVDSSLYYLRKTIYIVRLWFCD